MIQRARTFLARPTLASRLSLVAILIAFVLLLESQLPLVAFFGELTVWWPTNGITLALLLMTRRRQWPWIFLGMTGGTAIGMVLRHDSASEVMSTTFCNCMEVLIPAVMLPRFNTLTEWLQEPRLVWNFVLYAVLLGPALSAVPMGIYRHLTSSSTLWAEVVDWGVADMVGIIMFTPLVLVLVSPDTYSLFRLQGLPSRLGPMLLLISTTWFVFHQNSYSIAFILSPIILLVAIRTGFSGSVLAINLLAPIATSATLHGLGPFASILSTNEPYRVLTLQVFLILALLMAFPISVAQVQQQSTATQLQLAYRQMEALATADTLTGLANRRRFDAALEVEWRRASRERQPVALLMLDADNFKAYNDLYGHPAGDACLQSIASAICDIPQRGSDLVARYGGEEFVVLLPGIDAVGSYNVAELVRANVSLLNLPHQGNATGRVTVSIGCASMIPHDGTSHRALMEASDRALYTAKQAGRDRVHLYTGSEKRFATATEPQLSLMSETSMTISS